MKKSNKTLMTSMLLFLIVAIFHLAGAFPVQAQNKSGNVIRLGAGNKGVVIRGRIQKPQAFYILSRSSLNYRALRKREDLIKKIIRAVKKTPF